MFWSSHVDMSTCWRGMPLQERLTLLVEERQRLVEAETKLRVGRGAAQPATNGNFLV